MDVVRIDKDKCILCGVCGEICVRRDIRMGDEAAEIKDQSRCIQCGHCVAICPTGAPILLEMNSGDFSDAPKQDHLPTKDSYLALIRNRRSIRKYKTQSIEQDLVMNLLDAARYSPSSNNVQALKFIVVQGTASINKLRSLTAKALFEYGQKIEKAVLLNESENIPLPEKLTVRKHYTRFFREVPNLIASGQDRIFWNAPAVVICHLDPKLTPFPVVDASVAVSQTLLMAETLGLGTCLIGLLVYALEESRELRDFLNIPEGDLVPITFVLGYPARKFRRLVGRKPSDVVWI